MKKTVATFGLVSGFVATVMTLVTIPFIHSATIQTADVLGYTSMVLSALLVFFGIRSYRERGGARGGGRAGFARGVAVGVLITRVSCAIYATLKGLYDHPATNAALSFATSFPIGLAVTVVSAAILRRR